MCNKLLQLETMLHEQCIEIANEFEIKYISLATQRKDMFGAFFRAAEDEENAYVAALSSAAAVSMPASSRSHRSAWRLVACSFKDAVSAKAFMLMEQAKEGGEKVLDDYDDETAMLLAVRFVLATRRCAPASSSHP